MSAGPSGACSFLGTLPSRVCADLVVLVKHLHSDRERDWEPLEAVMKKAAWAFWLGAARPVPPVSVGAEPQPELSSRVRETVGIEEVILQVRYVAPQCAARSAGRPACSRARRRCSSVLSPCDCCQRVGRTSAILLGAPPTAPFRKARTVRSRSARRQRRLQGYGPRKPSSCLTSTR